MGVTSAARKSLHRDSLMLRNRHEEFLRRLASPSPSPSVSRVVTPACSLPTTPHYYSASLVSHLALDSNANESPLGSRRTRRISVSPNDLALLSDENAELLSKLEKLETESAQADLAGRRKLRKLEKEIQGLREELELTQVKSDELQEKAKIGVDAEKIADEMWKKKMEREEKSKALRRIGKSESDLRGDTVRDFAPGSAVTSDRSSPNTTPEQGQPLAASSLDPIFQFPKQPIDHHDQADVFSAQPQTRVTIPDRELAVVSQLLLKIHELEEANAQITDQQEKTAATLHSVQKSAESIRRVYEGLGNADGLEWEIVADDDDQQSKGNSKTPAVDDETIRFQSFRRSLEITPSELMPMGDADIFADGITRNMQSTVNAVALNRIILNHKERKSVVGLFDMPPTVSPSSDGGTTESPELFAAHAESPLSAWPTNDTLHSPALSTLSIAAPSPFNEKGPTLRSELGSEFGDEWDATSVNHHLRNTSLYQLALPSTPASPVSTVQVGGNVDNLSRELPKLQTTSLRVRSGLHSPREQSAQPEIDHFLRGHRTERHQRLSQTIRLRTNQWTDGRFKDTLLGTKNAHGQAAEGTETRKPLTPIPRRLAGVFDSVVGTLTGPEDHAVTTSQEVNDGGSPQNSKTEVEPSHNTGDNANSLGKLIFELWLWLQFCILILVFVCAMAKRGPKSVFDEAERRRVSSTRHHHS